MLYGKKVYLCAVEQESIEQLRVWRNDPELRKYFREYKELSSTMQREWFETRVLNNNKHINFEIRDKDTKELIGQCGLYYISWIHRQAEFGIYIGNPNYRTGGYGSDALRILIKYGFDDLNLNRVGCEVYSNNAALEVYEHIGFVREGTLRQSYYNEGKYWDSYLLSILKEEYEEKYG